MSTYTDKILNSIQEGLDYNKLSIDSGGFQYGLNVLEFTKDNGEKYIITVNKTRGSYK